ncbi:PilW family protein [Flexistipes sp.]|uniref:PilW family protein n=1 Tax=Flexistipes sp. TaxID=3088135 RepID=UPI002E1BB747|nr:prepilin-type N-terminal cleavage/methylation domain-containing protein [Flexistipes sp.]
MKKGFTLIELLVSMAIFAILIAGVYYTYISLYSDYKHQTVNVESEIENLLGQNIVRLDIEHAGMGVPDNSSINPIEWDNAANHLKIVSSVNSTNQDTLKWALIDCDNGSWTKMSGDDLNDNLTFINVFTLAEDNGSNAWGTCPGNSVYTVYPERTNIAIKLSENTNGDSGYTGELKICNDGTYNLLRGVGVNAGKNDNQGSHIIDCVADFKVTFDYDEDGGGTLDLDEYDLSKSVPNPDKIRAVNVYLLVQEGKYDRNLNFTNNVVGGSYVLQNVNPDGDDITLSLPAGYEHYKWNPIVMKVKPMGLVNDD